MILSTLVAIALASWPQATPHVMVQPEAIVWRGAAGGLQTAIIHDGIARYLRTREAHLIAFRRDLHQHPEVSGREERTSRVIADRLRALGLTVRTGIGGHGVVATVRGGKPGPLVAYRADMDAVPSGAPDPVSFASLTPGVRHICGHDMHVTVAIALVEALTHVRADLAGSVMFIFQPAEERVAGARAMLEAGLFSTDKPVAIYGVHLAPFEVGQVAVKAGVMMFPNGPAPGATNDEALTAAAKAAIVTLLGANAAIDLAAPPPGFSEDFGFFQREVPGVFFFLGASNAATGVVAMPHSAAFVADEGAIVAGARAMAAVLLDRLTTGAHLSTRAM